MGWAGRTGMALICTGLQMVGLHAVSLGTASPAAAGVSATSSAQRIRGTVVALDRSVLTVATGTRIVAVTLSPDFGVTALVATRPEAVAPGRFVGIVATRGPKGVLRARELHIYPDKWRSGSGGETSFDLGAGSLVVTGTIEQGLVDETGGTVTLTYPAGVAVVLVPPGTPVVTLAPGRRTMLTPGAHIVVEADGPPRGPLQGDHVMVGADGLVPSI